MPPQAAPTLYPAVLIINNCPYFRLLLIVFSQPHFLKYSDALFFLVKAFVLIKEQQEDGEYPHSPHASSAFALLGYLQVQVHSQDFIWYVTVLPHPLLYLRAGWTSC